MHRISYVLLGMAVLGIGLGCLAFFNGRPTEIEERQSTTPARPMIVDPD